MSVVPLFVTRQQAAEQLCLDVRTIDRLCESGLLEKREVSARGVRITSASLERHLASLQASTRAAEARKELEDDPFPIPELDRLKREAEESRAAREADHAETSEPKPTEEEAA